jgi:hypothetical protein
MGNGMKKCSKVTDLKMCTVYIFKIWGHFHFNLGWNDIEIYKWMNTKYPFFSYKTPMDMLFENKGSKVIEFLNPTEKRVGGLLETF